MSTINETILGVLSDAYPAGVSRTKLNKLCLGLDSRQISNALARLRDTGVIESEEENGQRVIYLVSAPDTAASSDDSATSSDDSAACSDESTDVAPMGVVEGSAEPEPETVGRKNSAQTVEPISFGLEFALADLEARLQPREIDDLPTKQAVLSKLAALMDESIARVLNAIRADLERAA